MIKFKTYKDSDFVRCPNTKKRLEFNIDKEQYECELDCSCCNSLYNVPDDLQKLLNNAIKKWKSDEVD